MSSRTRRAKPPKPEAPSRPRDIFWATLLWAAVVFAFAYSGEYIGIAMITLIYLVWQLYVATRLPGGFGDVSRAFRDSRSWKVLRFFVAWTLIIGTIVAIVTGY